MYRALTQIGTISIGRDMKEALQKDSGELEKEANGKDTDAKNDTLTPEQKAAKEAEEERKEKEKEKEREERVSALVEKLTRKLSIYTESVATASDETQADEARAGFREIVRLEAEELKAESFGVELLHAVGFVYAAKSRHYLAANGLFGTLGGMFHAASSSFHTVRETVSTVRAALELKSVFEELEKAEEQGITEERKRQLEEQAAEKGYVPIRLTQHARPVQGRQARGGERHPRGVGPHAVRRGCVKADTTAACRGTGDCWRGLQPGQARSYGGDGALETDAPDRLGDPIVDARIVQREVLHGNHFDHLLCHNAAEVCRRGCQVEARATDAG